MRFKRVMEYDPVQHQPHAEAMVCGRADRHDA